MADFETRLWSLQVCAGKIAVGEGPGWKRCLRKLVDKNQAKIEIKQKLKSSENVRRPT